MSRDDANSHENKKKYPEEQNLEKQASDKDLRQSMPSDHVIPNSPPQIATSEITNEFKIIKNGNAFDKKQENNIENKSIPLHYTGHLFYRDETISIEGESNQPFADITDSNSTPPTKIKLPRVESNLSPDISQPNSKLSEHNKNKSKYQHESYLDESLYLLDTKVEKLEDILCKTFVTEKTVSDKDENSFGIKIDETELKDKIKELLYCKSKTPGIVDGDVRRRRQRLPNKLSSILNFVAKMLPPRALNAAGCSLSVPRLTSPQALIIPNVQTVAQVCQPDVSPFRQAGKCPESLVSDLLSMINGKCPFPPVYLYTTPCQNPECKYEFPILPPRLVDKTAQSKCIERKFVSICKLNCLCRDGCLLHVINFLEGIFGCRSAPKNISVSRPASAKVSFDNPPKTRSQDSMCSAMMGACGSVSCTQSHSRPVGSDVCTSTTSITSTQNLTCRPSTSSTSVPKREPAHREPTMCQKWFSMPDGKCHEKKREVSLKPYPSRASLRPSCVSPVCNVAPPKEHACIGPRKENTECIECRPPNYYGEQSHKPCSGVDPKCLQQVLQKRAEGSQVKKES